MTKDHIIKNRKSAAWAMQKNASWLFESEKSVV